MPAAEVALGARRWDGGDRLPVLLVHGLSSNARLWDEVAAALAPDPTGPAPDPTALAPDPAGPAGHGPLPHEPAWHPVLAVDLRGHGTSAGVPDPPGSDATEVAVADLVAVCASLGWHRVLVAGQSWGGNIALQLAARHPGLVGGLVLVDGGWLHLGDRWPDLDAAWRTLAPPDLTRWRAAELRTVLADAHPDWSSEAVEATLANLEQLPDGGIRPWLSRERHRDRVASLLAHRPRELYPLVRCPAILLAAGDPPDAMAQEAAAAVSHASLVAFPGGEHDLHAQHPGRVAEAILRVAIGATA